QPGDAIGPWNELKVPRPGKQTTSAEDIAINPEREVGCASTDVQVEKITFGLCPAQPKTTPHEGEPGFQAWIIRGREQGVAHAMLNQRLDGGGVPLFSGQTRDDCPA